MTRTTHDRFSTQPDSCNSHGVLEENYSQLISPAGIALKKIIVQDPLGIFIPRTPEMQLLRYDENFELYDNYIVTKDHRHFLFFISQRISLRRLEKIRRSSKD